MILALFATALTLGDGLFTPSTSVVSAVSGILVPAPHVSGIVVPLSIVILLVLFGLQQFGTTRISIIFSPIVLVYMLLLAVTGIVNSEPFPYQSEAIR